MIACFACAPEAMARKTKKASTKAQTTERASTKKSGASLPRSADAVKAEKKQNEQRIKQAQQQITENRKRTSRQLNALNSLNGQILQQNADIAQLTASIASLDSMARGIADTIKIIEADVEVLRGNYASSLRRRREARQGLSAASLIFSSESFYQALKRIEYIKQLEKWREEKTERLRSGIELLNLKRAGLTDLRKKHAIAVNNLNTGKRRLQEKKKQTEVLVASLKKETAGLEAELRDRQKRARTLDAELDRIIAEEIRRAEAERIAAEKAAAERAAKEKAEAERIAKEQAEREKAEREKSDKIKPGKDKGDKSTPQQPTPPDEKKTAPTKPVTPKPDDTEKKFMEKAEAERKLTGSFESNQGKLLFPVSGKYNITGTFGRSRHANLSKIEIENSGIDIETTPGAKARAVFDGTVSSIFYMDGYHNIVMVRHGEYLTVYTNLDNLSVKKGDKVKTGQALGRVFSDTSDDNRTTLHFEVRKERTKLNPLNWVK